MVHQDLLFFKIFKLIAKNLPYESHSSSFGGGRCSDCWLITFVSCPDAAAIRYSDKPGPARRRDFFIDTGVDLSVLTVLLLSNDISLAIS